MNNNQTPINGTTAEGAGPRPLLALALAALVLTGCASKYPSPARPNQGTEAAWQRAAAADSMDAYVRFLKAGPAGEDRHSLEAKERLKALSQQSLDSSKRVAITLDAAAASGVPVAVKDGLMKVVAENLQQHGYVVTGVNSSNQITVSISFNKYLSGTSRSYWHLNSAVVVSTTFSVNGVGPLFKNSYQGPVKIAPEAVSYPSFRVIPVDATAPTYVDPAQGTVWGEGVQMIAASNDPAVIAADRDRFNEYDGGFSASPDGILDAIRNALDRSSPIVAGPSTVWCF